jgi:hypothetical protein
VKDFIKQQIIRNENRDFTNKLKENLGKEKAVNKDEFKKLY